MEMRVRIAFQIFAVLSIVFDIKPTHSASTGSADPPIKEGSPDPSIKEGSPASLTEERCSQADNVDISSDESHNQLIRTLLPVTKDLEKVIDDFIREYKRVHDVTITDRELEKDVIVTESSYFTSGILRLNFTYKKGDVMRPSSVLLKIPQLGVVYEHGKKMFLYEKERFMYETVIPRIYNNTPYEKPSPRLYASTDSGILVLENLEESGFETGKKHTLLDLATSKVVLSSLAQFHVLSTIHMNELSAQLDSLTVMDRTEGEWFKNMFPANAKKLQEYVLPSCSDSTKKRIDELLKPENSHPRIIAAFTPAKDGLNVLLHGDLYNSNLLLRRDSDNGVVECKFIDFQHSRRGSPILDLIYFFITSVPVEVFENHRDELYTHYVEEFRNTLQKLNLGNSRAYTLDDLKIDFDKHKECFLIMLITLTPHLWAGSSANESVFKSERYANTFKIWEKFLR